MRTILLSITICALLLASCKKDQEIYTSEVNLAISSQSFAVLGLYDIVNIHSEMINGAEYGGCFNRATDTVGATVYDTIGVAAGSSCGFVTASNTSGWFTAIYPETAATAPGELVTITFNSFKSNGVTFSGTLTYSYLSADTVHVTTHNLIMTDVSGSTTVTADLMISWDSGRTLSGFISGAGAHTYSWTILGQLHGGTMSSEIHSGKALFNAYDREITENFGNGEEDDFAIFEDALEERKVLVLPKL